MLRHLLLLTAIILFAACSGDKVDTDLEATELALYQSAQGNLRSGNYESAVAKLQLLEARFPFGRYAEQAQLEIIYAYFRSFEPESARAAADRFIRLHPNHPNVDYAYYLKAMASFEEDKSFLSQIFAVDPSRRDPGAARESFDDFSQLIRRFPNSEYAPDSQKKMKYLRNLLAESEIHVARYYIYRGAYIAAANRGRYVFENFQGATAVPDALAIMVEAYELLNMPVLANNALMVLSENYPNHESLRGNGQRGRSVKNSERSWLSIITFGLLG